MREYLNLTREKFRQGAAIDTARMESSFIQLGYIVKVCNTMNNDFTLNRFEQLMQDIHLEIEYLELKSSVIFVSAHGGEGFLRLPDSSRINIKADFISSICNLPFK